MAKCRIIYDDLGNIAEVFAANGKPSFLWEDLAKKTGNPNLAYDEYLLTRTSKFKKWFGRSKAIDENKEPTLKAFDIYKTIEALERPAPKITENFDGYDIENINKFKRWVKDNLPEYITVAEIDDLGRRLAARGMTAGYFSTALENIAGGTQFTGRIHTTDQSPFKYHEAFHAVYRLLLSDAEIAKFTRIGRKGVQEQLKKEGYKVNGILTTSLNEALESLRNSSPIYQEMNKSELMDALAEEWIADEFEKFKMNPQSSKIDSEVKSWFQRLIDWIVSLFERHSPADLQKLFDKIDSGKFRSSNVAVNRFTNDNTLGVSNVAMKVIPEGRKIMFQPTLKEDGSIDKYGKEIWVTTYLPQEVQNKLIATITSMYIEKERAVKGVYNPSSLLQETIAEYIQLYNPNDSYYSQNFTPSQLRDIRRKVSDRYRALNRNIPEIQEAVEEYLGLFDVKITNELEEKLQDEDFDSAGQIKTVDQFDIEANQIGGWKSLSTEIRKFIATVMVDTVDEFGRTVQEPVNFIEAYNGLLKSVKNTTNAVQIIKKMALYAKTSMHTGAVINAIFDKIGLGDLSLSEISDPEFSLDKTEVANPLFFQSIVKGFTQFRIDYIFAEADPTTGVVHLYAANHKDDGHSQLDRWSSAYSTKYEDLRDDTDGKRRKAAAVVGQLFRDLKMRNITDNDLSAKVQKTAKDLQETIGISLSEGYIKYSIVSALTNLTPLQQTFKDSFEKVEVMESEDILAIEEALGKKDKKTGKYNPVLFTIHDDAVQMQDLDDDAMSVGKGDESGVKSRLQKFARGNAIFDETVGTTVFRDPEGNLIYAHQMPTYHLEKIESLNDESEIDRLKGEDPFLKDNYLLNNPKFVDMAKKGLLRVIRITGYKNAKLQVAENGDIKSSRSLSINKRPGVKFGQSNPSELLSQLINSYLYNYNYSNGKVDSTTIQVEGSDGTMREVEYTWSPIDIKIIEASNTGDLIALPINNAVQSQKETGNPQATEEYIDSLEAELLREYNRINRVFNSIEDEDLIEGYNDWGANKEINDELASKHRGAKLNKTGELVTRRTKPTSNKVQEKAPWMNKDEVKKISNSNNKILLRTANSMRKSKVTIGKPIIAPLQGNEDVKLVYENKGLLNIEDLDFTTVKDKFGDLISGTYNAVSHKYKVVRGSETMFVANIAMQKFLTGKTSYHVLEVNTLEDAGIEAGSTQDQIIGYSVNKDIKRFIEDQARAGASYMETKQMVKDRFGFDIRDMIRERLNLEFSELESLMTDLSVYKKLNIAFTEGLKTSDGSVNNDTKRSMSLLNLKEGKQRYNLMQVFLNDYLNTKSINQVLLGDVAMTLKDAVDEIKRAKMQNASGPSAESLIAAPEYGIMHPVKDISMVSFHDPMFNTKYVRSKTSSEKTDAQMYMTVKAFRYMMFGFGRLNAAQAEILNKVQRGEEISIEEFYGNAKAGTKGFKDLDAIINSKKLVYGDGKTFIKMSAFVLTPQLTTNLETGEPLPTKKELHYLRENLEEIERKGSETIGIAVPTTASKMLKRNILNSAEVIQPGADILDNNITHLDAKWMRLQQINPSNKTENIDPRQIKQLITGEQDDAVMVTIGGVEMSIGEVRKLYNREVGDRVENKYLARRNLIWTFESANNELEKSIRLNQVTKDLQGFLDYAVSGLEASQAKSQMLEFFSGDYNLNNPITLQKFQELFMSYFSKGIMSERQPGHTVSLVSDWGMKVIKKVKELDPVTKQPIRWDIIREQDYIKNPQGYGIIKFDNYTEGTDREFTGIKVNDLYIDELRHNVMEYVNGKPTGTRYSEFVLPAHFVELAGLIPGETIPDAISKMFGVRIPSQDKHSAINLKLVDFLPVFYGSSGAFPQELIEISGADFDIDKIYINNKEFYVNENGEFVEYGKTKNLTDAFSEYGRYTLKKMNEKGTTLNQALKVFRKRATGRSYEVDLVKEPDQIYQEWNEWAAKGKVKPQDENFNVVKSQELFAKLTGYPYDSSKQEFLPYYKEKPVGQAEMVGALSLLKLPVTKAEYAEFIEKHKREPFVAPQNNRILDYKFALLGNKGMSDPSNSSSDGIANEPAVLDPLLEVWEFIQSEMPELALKVNEEDVDVDNLVGKTKAWTNNKAGEGSIGAAVLPNLVMSLLAEYGVNVRREGGLGPIGQIKLNGITYDKFNTQFGLEKIKGKTKSNGVRTQFVISALITAMTDNAKERLAAKLGLNKNALGVVTNMVALGVPIKDAILIINHPTIQHEYFFAINKEDPMDPGIEARLNSVLRVISAQDPQLVTNGSRKSVTTDMLIDQIKKINYVDGQKVVEGEGGAQEVNIENEVAIINLFLNAYAITDATRKVTSLITLLAGMGRDTQNILDRQKSIDDLGVEMDSKDFNATNIPIDVRAIFKSKNLNTLQSRFYSIYKDFVSLLPTVFITETQAYQKFYDLIMSNVGRFANRDAAFKNQVKKDILSYLNAKSYIKYLQDTAQGGKLTSLQNGLIYDEFSEGQITISDVITNLRKAAPDNYFINNYVFNKKANNPTNKAGTNEAISNTWTRLSDSQIVNLQRELVDLWTNENTRMDVEHLINYLLVKDGLQFKPYTFLNVIPAVMLKEVTDTMGNAHELFMQDNVYGQAFKNIFGSTYQEMSQDMLDAYLMSQKNTFYLSRLKNTPKQLTKDSKEAPGAGYYDTTTGVAKFDLFAELMPQSKGREGARKKRRYWRGQKTNQTVNKIKNNKSYLQNLGFTFVSRPYRGREVDLMIAPHVLVMNVGTYETPSYVYLQLTEAQTPLTEVDKTDLYDIEQDQNVAFVNGATYKAFDPFGSNNQNPMMGMKDLGSRSTYKSLLEMMKARDAGGILEGVDIDQNMDNVEGNIEENVEAFVNENEDLIQEHFGGKTSITINIDESGKADINIEKDNKNTTAEKLSEMSNEKEVIDLSTIETGGGVKLSSIKNAAKSENNSSQSANINQVENFWDNELTDSQKDNIARSTIEGGLNVKSKKDLVNLFKDPRNQYKNFEDFRDDIINCKA